ncbi:MafI family immunity protein [Hymenobacter cellulosilyticus]|nr:MafI family immunity protein [Hymenobacter cellulosilyticus]
MRKQQEKYWTLLSAATALGLPPRDCANAKDMFDYAEWEVGFDIIVVQLYEFDIKITEHFFQQVEALATGMNLPPKSYNFLKKLIQPS